MRIRKKTRRRLDRLIVVVEVLVLIGTGAPQLVRAQGVPGSPEVPVTVVETAPPAPPPVVVEHRSLPQVADKPQPAARRTIWVTVTAYSSTVDQTDSDPFTTASGEKVRDGIVAWNGVPFDTRLRLPSHYGPKIFIVKDRLNPRATRYHIDLWMPTREQAKEWGARIIKVEIL